MHQFVDLFKKIGLQSINVSLDSLNKENLHKITRRDYFDTIMSNVHLLLQEGFHVKLNAVLMKDVNDHELIDFIEFTKHNRIHFRFIEFMPFDGNKWDWSKGVSYQEIMNQLGEVYHDDIQRIEDAKHDTAKNYKIQGYTGTFAVISSVTNPFCDTCNRIRLTADGKLKNCLFSNTETDLLASFRQSHDIKPLILDSVWKKKSMRGGMNTFQKLSDSTMYSQNRSIVAIGG